ncbi:nucleoside-diphosphate-sugar epimerase [Paraburkholderia sp. MM5384-R2]|nr:nucleoside-diphosphate-sugar epimerase [Paraburkholderia sp. MM5384-R2]
MKIVVIGGIGLIGSKTVEILRQRAMRSSPRCPKAVKQHYRRGAQGIHGGRGGGD